MTRAETTPQLCQKFHRASELVGRRWTGAIIYVLLRARCRFATLREAIPEITDRMLSERLQELEQEGIVERTVVPDTPVRVEYALTEKGRALIRAFDALGQWAETWVTLEAPAAPHPAPRHSRPKRHRTKGASRTSRRSTRAS